jgi:hypothetical protein
MDFVTYAEIARTYTSGRIQLELDLDADDSIFVFTTAIGVTVQCQNVLKKRLRVINRENISREIDNNVSFWQMAYDEVKETLLGKVRPRSSSQR